MKITKPSQFLSLIFDIIYATGGSLSGQYDIVRIGHNYYLVRADARTLQYNLKSARKIKMSLDKLSNKDLQKLKEMQP